jgi:hypothetical protein
VVISRMREPPCRSVAAIPISSPARNRCPHTPAVAVGAWVSTIAPCPAPVQSRRSRSRAPARNWARVCHNRPTGPDGARCPREASSWRNSSNHADQVAASLRPGAAGHSSSRAASNRSRAAHAAVSSSGTLLRSGSNHAQAFTGSPARAPRRACRRRSCCRRRRG